MCVKDDALPVIRGIMEDPEGFHDLIRVHEHVRPVEQQAVEVVGAQIRKRFLDLRQDALYKKIVHSAVDADL